MLNQRRASTVRLRNAEEETRVEPVYLLPASRYARKGSGENDRKRSSTMAEATTKALPTGRYMEGKYVEW